MEMTASISSIVNPLFPRSVKTTDPFSPEITFSPFLNFLFTKVYCSPIELNVNSRPISLANNLFQTRFFLVRIRFSPDKQKTCNCSQSIQFCNLCPSQDRMTTLSRFIRMPATLGRPSYLNNWKDRRKFPISEIISDYLKRT